MELRLEAPPATDTAAVVADTTAVEDEAPPPLELDPVLFVVERGGDSVRMIPAAVVDSTGLRSFPTEAEIPGFLERFREERMAPGRRFALFSGGRRVGTVHAGSPGSVDTTFCAPRPTATGRVELVPEAMAVERFLALPWGPGDSTPPADFERITSTRTQRVASLNMAAALFSTMEIQWPPSIVEARADLQLFRPEGSEGDLMAATFLYGDELAIGGALPNAYSLFFLGEQTDGEYDPTYIRYREVGVDGKSATRFVDHLDWDGDGGDEVLLEVYGTERRWFEAVGREAGEWTETFVEGCAETGTAPVALRTVPPGPSPAPADGPAP